MTDHMTQIRQAAANGDPTALALLQQQAVPAHVGAPAHIGAPMSFLGAPMLAPVPGSQPGVLAGFTAPGITPRQLVDPSGGLEDARFRGSVAANANASIAASGTQTITITPQHDFRPERMLIVATGSAGFSINSVTVRGQNQLEGTGTAHSSAFGPGAFDNRIRLDEIDPANPLVLSVTNLDTGAAQGCYVHLFGTSVR